VIQAELRAKVHELMASGALPSDPPVIQRSGQDSVGARRNDVCAICTEADPAVLYWWFACTRPDALWKQEREKSGGPHETT
jgi:hypothetical protein